MPLGLGMCTYPTIPALSRQPSYIQHAFTLTLTLIPNTFPAGLANRALSTLERQPPLYDKLQVMGMGGIMTAGTRSCMVNSTTSATWSDAEWSSSSGASSAASSAWSSSSSSCPTSISSYTRHSRYASGGYTNVEVSSPHCLTRATADDRSRTGATRKTKTRTRSTRPWTTGTTDRSSLTRSSSRLPSSSS